MTRSPERQQRTWQEAVEASQSPEDAAAAQASRRRTKRWIIIGAVVLAAWIGVVLIGFIHAGAQPA